MRLQQHAHQLVCSLSRSLCRQLFLCLPSQPYIKKLHKCWVDPKSLSHHTSDGRALVSMQNASSDGLGQMPAVEPSIASLIVSPNEVLRPDARCLRLQCYITDDFLVKCYDIAVRTLPSKAGPDSPFALLVPGETVWSSSTAGLQVWHPGKSDPAAVC